jgi:hypothetical protein
VVAVMGGEGAAVAAGWAPNKHTVVSKDTWWLGSCLLWVAMRGGSCPRLCAGRSQASCYRPCRGPCRDHQAEQ